MQPTMRYLIDGYNLLHAIGAIRHGMGPAQLKSARLRLGAMLKRMHATNDTDVTVVFDAAGAPRGAAEIEEYDGIRFHYAVHQSEADDLIEVLIRRDPVPRQLAVVSDDHRLQRAARRRGCRVLACSAYLDELEQRPAKGKSGTSDEKPASGLGPLDHFLAEFSDLENDPDLKPFFDLDRFPEAETKPEEP